MNSNDSLKLIKETRDNLGITHQRYQQYYKGIKIEGGEFLLHGRNDTIDFMNGNFETVEISSVVPKLTEKQALAQALQFVNAEKYLWEDTIEERHFKERANNPDFNSYPKGELVIAKDYMDETKDFKLSTNYKLVYIISIFVPHYGTSK